MGINMKFPVKNKMAMIYNERSLIHSWASLTGWKARGEAGGQTTLRQGDGSSIKSNLNQPRIGEFGDFGCGLSNYLREARQSNWNHVKVWPNVKNTKFPTKFDLSCFHFSSSQLIIFFLENDVRFSEIFMFSNKDTNTNTDKDKNRAQHTGVNVFTCNPGFQSHPLQWQ